MKKTNQVFATSVNFILLALFCTQCGLSHLKRREIAERVDQPVASTPAADEIFGTAEASEDQESQDMPSKPTESPTPTPNKTPVKSKPFEPVTTPEENPVPATDDQMDDLAEPQVDTLIPESNPDPMVPDSEISEVIPVVAEELGPEIEEENTFDWQRVLITEVVTDPQQDHNGNASVSASDEYVEIFNGTALTLDVSAWQFNMRDGSDENLLIGEGGSEMFFSSSGGPGFFQSGEIMVLGNPRGTMNNNIELELLDEQGVLIDSVMVEDANADSLSDEAYFLDEDGNWGMGPASHGEIFW